jgi:hypothetical protein
MAQMLQRDWPGLVSLGLGERERERGEVWSNGEVACGYWDWLVWICSRLFLQTIYLLALGRPLPSPIKYSLPIFVFLLVSSFLCEKRNQGC